MKYNKKTEYILMAAAMMFTAMPAQAEKQLPTMVVTADRISEDESMVSADVTVISEQDIKQSQATSVVDLLRDKAGIDVSSNGGPGRTTSVFLRGGGSGHTLVLIDGVRMGSATTGAFNWGSLSVADIERIEIVRGPQSSLYGADAMGGVIQIFTRKGTKETQIRVHAEAGSYGTTAESLGLTGSAGEVRYGFSVDHKKSSYISTSANGVERDPYRQVSLSGNVSIPVAQGQLELTGRFSDSKAGLDNTTSDRLNYTSQTRQSMMSAKFTHPINDRIESSLQLSRSIDKQVGKDAVVTSNNNSDFRTYIDQLSWQNHIDMDDLSLLLGIDMHRDNGFSNSAQQDKTIIQKAGYLSAAWSMDWLDLNASIRHDRNSTSSNKTTYKTGLALHPVEGLKFSANYGTGFKAPSINGLYWPATTFSFGAPLTTYNTSGNTALLPETSRGWDVGVQYIWAPNEQSDIRFSAVLFKQNYVNLIDWVTTKTAPNTFLLTPTNINNATTKGLELSASITYDLVYLHGNWTFLDATDDNDGSLLQRRAKESGSLTAGADYAGLNLESTLRIVGPRFSGARNTKPMAGYHTTDIRLSYAVTEQWKISMRVENLEDKTYEEVSGYGVLGQAWYAGMSANF